ncbi:MAG: ATP-dependent Zn protease [Synechococcales cyanobacterium T60_A2020_003]|nr:ATP-dependent Zn protease [Synechococcales cyanobacterium T60_A2020_003]
MSNTTLNLVAIAIFSLVILSLVGPLVQISPVVPAIAAFGMLSIATVDTLQWQGRGGTLLLDWVANFSPEHRQRVIRHEAGHFLVAYLLEIPVTGYTLTAWDALKQGQPGLGGVSFDSQALEAQLANNELSVQLVDRYCTVWMAGIAAEQSFYGNVEGGADDRQTIQILWSQLRRPSSEAELKQRWATLQATTLLENHQAAYNALVSALERRASVEECCTAIAHAL